MAVTFESAARLTALKNKIDKVTGAGTTTLSEAVDNALAGYGQGGKLIETSIDITLASDVKTNAVNFVDTYIAPLAKTDKYCVWATVENNTDTSNYRVDSFMFIHNMDIISLESYSGSIVRNGALRTSYTTSTDFNVSAGARINGKLIDFGNSI